MRRKCGGAAVPHGQKKRKEICAMNPLAKSGSQSPTPELRTSTILGRSRREEALTLFSRVHIPQTPLNSISPFSFSSNLTFLEFWDLLPANFRPEMLPKNLKHFRSNLKRSALYQALTKNFTTKAEMLKCYFGPWACESFLGHWCLAIGHLSGALRILVLALLPLETIPETFQAVSRNAETLALQMKDLRRFEPETIKKISLKRFSLSPWERHPDFAKQVFKDSRMHPGPELHFQGWGQTTILGVSLFSGESRITHEKHYHP
jgi:hypothetical protein